MTGISTKQVKESFSNLCLIILKILRIEIFDTPLFD